MSTIVPAILPTIQYMFIAYGYYSLLSQGRTNYNTGRWLYEKTTGIYRKVKGTDSQWETVDNLEVINLKDSNLIIVRDEVDGGFVLLDKFVYQSEKQLSIPLTQYPTV
jgi:hypothetical protein